MFIKCGKGDFFYGGTALHMINNHIINCFMVMYYYMFMKGFSYASLSK